MVNGYHSLPQSFNWKHWLLLCLRHQARYSWRRHKAPKLSQLIFTEFYEVLTKLPHTHKVIPNYQRGLSLLWTPLAFICIACIHTTFLTLLQHLSYCPNWTSLSSGRVFPTCLNFLHHLPKCLRQNRSSVFVWHINGCCLALYKYTLDNRW